MLSYETEQAIINRYRIAMNAMEKEIKRIFPGSPDLYHAKKKSMEILEENLKKENQ